MPAVMLGQHTCFQAESASGEPDSRPIHQIVLIKDSWWAEDVPKEWETIRRLHVAGVSNIPHLICSGTLESDANANQVTRTQDYAKCKWNRAGEYRGDRQIHPRFLMREIGIPLEKFRSAPDLFWAVKDAVTGTLSLCFRALVLHSSLFFIYFEAHKQAYEKLHILHCDISTGNILLYCTYESSGEPGKEKKEVWHGLLIDWEYAQGLESEALQCERTASVPYPITFSF